MSAGVLSSRQTLAACALGGGSTVVLAIAFPLPLWGVVVLGLVCGHFAARCVVAWARR